MQIQISRRIFYSLVVLTCLFLLVYGLGDFFRGAKAFFSHEVAHASRQGASDFIVWTRSLARGARLCAFIFFGIFILFLSRNSILRYLKQVKFYFNSSVKNMETTFSFQMPQEARVFSEALNRMDALAEQTGAAADTIHQAMRYMQQSQQYSLEGRKMLAEIETSTQEWEGMGSQFRGLVEHVDALSLQSVHMKNLLMEFRVLGLNAAIAAAKAGDGHSWMQMAERWTTLAVVAEAQWATVQSRVSESTREVGRLAAYAQERVQVVQESSQKFDSTFTAITASLAVAAETFTELAIVSSAQESEMKAVRQAMQEWSAS